MKSCIFYTLLLPALYALLWYQGEYFIPAYMEPAMFLLSMVLASIICCIGWLWIQRRPVRSPETPYICFMLPLSFMLIVSICYVHATGYDGFNTIFGLFVTLAANAICCAALVGLTCLLQMLWRIVSAPKLWK